MMTKVLRVLNSSWQYAVTLTFAAIFGFPLLWTFYSSLKTSKEILKGIWALPANPTLNGYIQVFTSSSFGLYYRNSIIVTLTSVPALVVVSSMAAYAFARIRFRGR